MPLPAITYALVTIGLIMICLYLIYALVLPRFSIVSNVIVLDYELHIDDYTILKLKSNTNIVINKEKIPEGCSVLYNNTSIVYIVCNCKEVSKPILKVQARAGLTFMYFIVRCPK